MRVHHERWRRRPAPSWPLAAITTSTGSAYVRPTTDGLGGELILNGVPVSQVGNPDDEVDFEYMQHFVAVLAAWNLPVRTRALHLGAAGCTMARWLAAYRPQARQLAVEIDEDLATAVREWFDLPRAPLLRIRVGDARTELATRRTDSADVIIRDAFDIDTTPPHLQTLEFVNEVARVLAPGGVYLANAEDRPPLRHIRHEVATISAVFTHVGLIAEPGQFKMRRHGNFVLVASADPLPDLGRTLRTLAVPARMLTGADLNDFYGHARVWTDATIRPSPDGPESPQSPRPVLRPSAGPG